MKIVQSIEEDLQDDITYEELSDLLVLFYCNGFYGPDATQYINNLLKDNPSLARHLKITWVEKKNIFDRLADWLKKWYI